MTRQSEDEPQKKKRSMTFSIAAIYEMMRHMHPQNVSLPYPFYLGGKKEKKRHTSARASGIFNDNP